MNTPMKLISPTAAMVVSTITVALNSVSAIPRAEADE